MTAAPRFASEEPESDLKPFTITGWTFEGDGDQRERVEVEETFHARTDVSYGLILRELDVIETGGSPFGVFRKVLGSTDSDSEDAAAAEFERFEEFVASERTYISRTALIGALRWIAGEQSDRPTQQPSASRSTRRAGARGSVGTRQRHG